MMDKTQQKKSSGVLMHLSSLPSEYGIGSMGAPARKFVDFLKEAGQTYWQMLPICPTSYGDSPYQSFSAYAGNPYFIDLEMLESAGYLEAKDYKTVDWESAPDHVNYGALYQKRYPILRKAVRRFQETASDDYEAFCRQNDYWLHDYASFMALKAASGGKAWMDWEPALRNREQKALEHAAAAYKEEIEFWKSLQYLFFEQWKTLREYANEAGLQIIGDLPIYVSLDSVDVWAHPELFQLDENKVPREVAGCPPDGFSADGQLWGNPLFDWDYMKQNGYRWWTARIGYLCKVYDMLRIDHFRGFDSYFAIPYGDTNAKRGYWKQGPGMDLFHAVEQQIGAQNIMAEDLGYMTESVKKLLADSGFPGIKLLQFAFDSRDGGGTSYFPEDYPPNCVAYVGTHDNDTAVGWTTSAEPEDVKRAYDYLGVTDAADINWVMMRAIWDSRANLTIVLAQDLLGLGSESRMNKPSTVGSNWCWRAVEGCFTDALAAKVRGEMERFGRLDRPDKKV